MLSSLVEQHATTCSKQPGLRTPSAHLSAAVAVWATHSNARTADRKQPRNLQLAAHLPCRDVSGRSPLHRSRSVCSQTSYHARLSSASPAVSAQAGGSTSTSHRASHRTTALASSPSRTAVTSKSISAAVKRGVATGAASTSASATLKAAVTLTETSPLLSPTSATPNTLRSSSSSSSRTSQIATATATRAAASQDQLSLEDLHIISADTSHRTALPSPSGEASTASSVSSLALFKVRAMLLARQGWQEPPQEPQQSASTSSHTQHTSTSNASMLQATVTSTQSASSSRTVQAGPSADQLVIPSTSPAASPASKIPTKRKTSSKSIPAVAATHSSTLVPPTTKVTKPRKSRAKVKPVAPLPLQPESETKAQLPSSVVVLSSPPHTSSPSIQPRASPVVNVTTHASSSRSHAGPPPFTPDARDGLSSSSSIYSLSIDDIAGDENSNYSSYEEDSILHSSLRTHSRLWGLMAVQVPGEDGVEDEQVHICDTTSNSSKVAADSAVDLTRTPTPDIVLDLGPETKLRLQQALYGTDSAPSVSSKCHSTSIDSDLPGDSLNVTHQDSSSSTASAAERNSSIYAQLAGKYATPTPKPSVAPKRVSVSAKITAAKAVAAKAAAARVAASAAAAASAVTAAASVQITPVFTTPAIQTLQSSAAVAAGVAGTSSTIQTSTASPAASLLPATADRNTGVYAQLAGKFAPPSVTPTRTIKTKVSARTAAAELVAAVASVVAAVVADTPLVAAVVKNPVLLAVAGTAAVNAPPATSQQTNLEGHNESVYAHLAGRFVPATSSPATTTTKKKKAASPRAVAAAAAATAATAAALLQSRETSRLSTLRFQDIANSLLKLAPLETASVESSGAATVTAAVIPASIVSQHVLAAAAAAAEKLAAKASAPASKSKGTCVPAAGSQDVVAAVKLTAPASCKGGKAVGVRVVKRLAVSAVKKVPSVAAVVVVGHADEDECEETASSSGPASEAELRAAVAPFQLPQDVSSAVVSAALKGDIAANVVTLRRFLSKAMMLAAEGGIGKELVTAVLRKQPNLLKQSNALLLDKATRLGDLLGCEAQAGGVSNGSSSCSMPRPALIKMLSSVPSLWGLKADTVRGKMSALGDLLGLERRDVQGMVRRAPVLLSSDPDTLSHKFRTLKALLQRPHIEAVRLVQAYPTVLYLSIDSVKARFEALTSLMEVTPKELGSMAATKPLLLTTSVETITATWGDLRAAAVTSKRWSKEFAKLGPATRAALVLASSTKVKRLTYLSSVSKGEEVGLSSLMIMGQPEFVARYPGYKAWARARPVVGALLSSPVLQR